VVDKPVALWDWTLECPSRATRDLRVTGHRGSASRACQIKCQALGVCENWRVSLHYYGCDGGLTYGCLPAERDGCVAVVQYLPITGPGTHPERAGSKPSPLLLTRVEGICC
jgi:hypothetical protein